MFNLFGKNNESDPLVSELISWAEQYDLPPLEAFDSPAYRQKGFPRDSREIHSLRYLFLPSCGISTLPPAIGRLQNLQAICLDDNQISEIPSEICCLANLVRLDLDDNQIKTFPIEIGGLRNLQVLSLENNSIQDFPIEMMNLQNLRRLNLKGNEIHLLSKYSPLSPDGFAVYQHFHFERDIIKQDSINTWLKNTDTSSLEFTD